MQREAKSLTRIYFPGTLAAGATVALPPAAAHHVARVLRLAAGDSVTLFNGAGGEYAAGVAAVSRDGVRVKVGLWRDRECESPLSVTLAQAISSGERMDYTVQKAVEVGVAALQPLAAERSVVRLALERAARRREHWQHVASAACEQCGRNRVPEVRAVCAPEVWLAGLAPPVAGELRLVLTPGAERRLADLPPVAGEVLLAAGPEGGFAPREQIALESRGFLPLALGPRVLRTETVAVVALAALQAKWGDL
jgi:16S rRNA (uracil1498-N3)-methyltransferase